MVFYFTPKYIQCLHMLGFLLEIAVKEENEDNEQPTPECAFEF